MPLTAPLFSVLPGLVPFPFPWKRFLFGRGHVDAWAPPPPPPPPPTPPPPPPCPRFSHFQAPFLFFWHFYCFPGVFNGQYCRSSGSGWAMRAWTLSVPLAFVFPFLRKLRMVARVFCPLHSSFNNKIRRPPTPPSPLVRLSLFHGFFPSDILSFAGYAQCPWGLAKVFVACSLLSQAPPFPVYGPHLPFRAFFPTRKLLPRHPGRAVFFFFFFPTFLAVIASFFFYVVVNPAFVPNASSLSLKPTSSSPFGFLGLKFFWPHADACFQSPFCLSFKASVFPMRFSFRGGFPRSLFPPTTPDDSPCAFTN